jgi:phosphohistidine phosphatase
MKTLLLMRHAKSISADPGRADEQRGLTPRGERDAARMARLLADHNLLPQVVLSSIAMRARDTVNILIKSASCSAQAFFYNELYASSPGQYLRLLEQLDSRIDTAMIVGHNPEQEEFIHLMCSADERMTTASIAQIQLDIAAWADLDRETPARLVSVWRPKELP